MDNRSLIGLALALTLVLLAACGGGTASPGNEYGGGGAPQTTDMPAGGRGPQQTFQRTLLLQLVRLH